MHKCPGSTAIDPWSTDKNEISGPCVFLTIITLNVNEVILTIFCYWEYVLGSGLASWLTETERNRHFGVCNAVVFSAPGKTFHVGLTLFKVPILSKKTVKCHMKTEPRYKHTIKNKLQACKRTRDFRCRLNCAVSVGHGADGGLDFGDAASFVAVLGQRSSRGCVPSAGGHTFSAFWLLWRSGQASRHVLLQTGSRPQRTGNEGTQKHCKFLKYHCERHK